MPVLGVMLLTVIDSSHALDGPLGRDGIPTIRLHPECQTRSRCLRWFGVSPVRRRHIHCFYRTQTWLLGSEISSSWSKFDCTPHRTKHSVRRRKTQAEGYSGNFRWVVVRVAECVEVLYLLEDRQISPANVIFALGFRTIGSRHAAQLCLRFGSESDAEAALQECKSSLGDTWDCDIALAEEPGITYASRTMDMDSGKTLVLGLGFRDRLKDVQRAVIPLGATSVCLCKSFEPRSQVTDNKYWSFTNVDNRVEAAYVVFPSQEAALTAKEALKGSSLQDDGPPVTFLQFPRPPPSVRSDNPPNPALWVAGLGRRTTKRGLTSFFKGAGGLEHVFIRKLLPPDTSITIFLF